MTLLRHTVLVALLILTGLPIASTARAAAATSSEAEWGRTVAAAKKEGKVSVFLYHRENLFYNKNLVDPKEFKSYWDMVDAKWWGKIVALDPRQPGRQRVGGRFIYNIPELGEKFLTRLFTEMDVVFSRDDRQALDWLAVGKYSLCLFCGNI